MLRTKSIAGALAAIALALTGATCQLTPITRAPASQPRYSELPPVPDRLRSFYHELQAGRFEILADLEQATQAQIFHVDGPGAAQLTVLKNRLATGAGALEVRLDSPSSVLLIDNEHAKDWALPRNWHPYQLFIASIHSQCPPSPASRSEAAANTPPSGTLPPCPSSRAGTSCGST